MRTITTVCRRCGQEFAPSRAEILAGPAIWHLCPDCRRTDAGDDPTPPTDRRVPHA